MSFKRFLKFSGVLSILAGLFIGTGTLLHPPVTGYADAVHTVRWNVVHAMVGIGLLLALGGLAGTYIRIAEEDDLYGMTGFFLALTGTALNAGLYLVHEGVLLPALDLLGDIDSLLASGSEITTTTLFVGLGAGTFLLSTLGYLLLGIKIYRSRSLPRWTGLLLLLGGPLFAGPAPTIGGVLLGAGFLWLGYGLWSANPS